MKKALSFFIVICILPGLSGCGGMRNQYKQLDQLLVIQSMGIDRTDNGVRLTLATASGGGKEAVCLSNSGRTISSALEHIRSYSFEEELFCAHVSHLLIGEEAAKDGIENILSYVCHSPELRIDLPIYIIKGAGAEEVMSSSGSGEKGITELMDSVRSSLEHRGDGNVFTAAELIGRMERGGSALVCALEYSDSSEKPSNDEQEQPKTMAVYGYAVLKDYKLVQFIDNKNAVGVGFLLNKVGICDITVNDSDGNTITLEIDSGSSKIQPVWSEDGKLSGIDIKAEVDASVLEATGNSADFDSAEYSNQLIAELESEISQRISSVLRLSKTLRADFLDLGSMVEYADPEQYRENVDNFSALLPKLELRISVKGQLVHTNDLKDA